MTLVVDFDDSKPESSCTINHIYQPSIDPLRSELPMPFPGKKCGSSEKISVKKPMQLNSTGGGVLCNW